MTELLHRADDAYPALSAEIELLATPERILDTLRRVGDVAAPSQTTSHTRGPVVSGLLADRGVLSAATYDRDFRGTGTDLVRSGDGGARLVAHLDEISYVLAGPADDGHWPLYAYCYHLADGPRGARVVRWCGEGYRIVSEGELLTAGGDLVYRPGDGARPEPGDRVVLHTPTRRDPDSTRVTGAIDNAAGVAAVLVACEILARCGVPFTAVLTDEEEGPSGCASTTINRGAMRVFPHLPAAPVTVVVDTQGLAADELRAADGHRQGWAACLNEYSSQTRGAVTPPHLYAPLRHLACELTSAGIPVRDNRGGYTPRSDDAAAQMFTRDVCLLGYPGVNRHFDHGMPAANLEDLRALAGALAYTAAVAAVGGLWTGPR